MPTGAVDFLQTVVMSFAGIGKIWEFLDWGFTIGEVKFSIVGLLSVGTIVALVATVLILHIWHLVKLIG